MDLSAQSQDTALGGDLLDRVLAETSAQLASARDIGGLDGFLQERDWVRALLLWFGTPDALRDRERMLRRLDRAIARLDRLLSDQTEAVLSHPRLVRLEASWRGVAYLTRAADAVEGVTIRLLAVSWAEVGRDHERALEFDQSNLFRMIYEDEFGMPGGTPYGLLVGDYELRHRPAGGVDDIAALRGMAQVAAAAFSPFVAGCDPALFGLDDFRDLAQPIDLAAIFRQPEYARWRSLRAAEDARFIGLVLPRVLVRSPWRDDASRTDGFRFHDDRGAPEEGGRHLWLNGAYAFASIVIRAFGTYGWFSEIRGTARDVLGGGLVVDLPVESFATETEGLALKVATEVALSDRQERELGELGFIPLSDAKDTPFAIFYSNQSIHVPLTYDRGGANANARLGVMLQYILCVSRFAHYVKVMARDRIGSYLTPEQCRIDLQRWLDSYCILNQDASIELQATHPLREAMVEVSEPPGRPGVYLCTIHLRPHFQLDEIATDFKLVTELAAARPG